MGNSPVRIGSLPIEQLRGVGPRTAERLRAKGICRAIDLLYFCPVSYTDRRVITTISSAEEAKPSSFVGRITSFNSVYCGRSRKKGFQALLEDATGSIRLSWFNFSRPYLERLLVRQGNFFVSGIVTRFDGQLQLIHPYIAWNESGRWEDERRIVPVYSEIQGVGQSIVRRLVKESFDCMATAGFRGLIPMPSEKYNDIMPLADALTSLHFPDDVGDGLLARARGRLILEEFFSFQAALFLKKIQPQINKNTRRPRASGLMRDFFKSLSFELTTAQNRVMNEIEQDFTRNTPMNRLLLGDVGCGKTLCTLFAACLAMDNGFQVAFMAPTEILAEQHYLSIRPALQAIGIESVLVTSSVYGKESALEGLKKGSIMLAVGTHALIEGDVRFYRLGLVIIDEQHRFGVLQRKAIIDKAVSPNVLAVTATPIPRTLSLVLYGHLDVSVIDEMPPGRLPVKTLVWGNEKKDQTYRLVRDELRRGGQAFLVFPVIEGRETDGLSGVTNQFDELTSGPFLGLSAGLLHGRLPVNEKERVMKGFKEGEIQLLACTTVIEVGLDVPNASMIVIHHAERFGLAQLHQLRGRVGRGARQSICVLLTDHDSTEMSRERLRIMEETTDGFRIAEADMAIRGPGELLGVRQSGLPRFRIGDVVVDKDVMSQARDLVLKILPGLAENEVAVFRQAVDERWGKDMGLADA